MKIKFINIVSTSLSLFCVTSWASQSIAVKSVYVPARGYDDNDAIVQFVVDAELPNSCYTQGISHATLNSENKTIEIVQLADRRDDGVCAAEDQNLPDNVRNPVPFTSEAKLRTLAAGDYSVVFTTKNAKGTKALHVDRAPSTSVDSFSYATITNIFAPANVPASEETFEIRITGTLNSSCTYLSHIDVLFVEDVVVVLPVVSQKMDICLPTSKPFYKVVKAKTPAKGRYLLHGRSQGSVAQYMLFSVADLEE